MKGICLHQSASEGYTYLISADVLLLCSFEKFYHWLAKIYYELTREYIFIHLNPANILYFLVSCSNKE